MKNNYRLEKKFFISNFTKQEVENIIKLHPAVFSEIYYERFVNNIYLDSFDLQNYFDNLIGSNERQKVRVRWYGDLFGRIESPVLEIKVKINNVSYKVAYPLNGFYLDNNFTVGAIMDIFEKSQLPESLKKELRCLDLALLNRYKRKYFQSRDKIFRFTIDSQVQYYAFLANWNNFLDKRVDRENIILELKCESNVKEEAVSFIANFLPCRITKSSKYALGIEGLNPW